MIHDPGDGVPHANHMENRLAYAQRIITYLDHRLPVGWRAANLCVLNRASWNKIATLAGEDRMPAEGTISCIIAMCRGREIQAQAVVEAMQVSIHNAEPRLLSTLQFEQAITTDVEYV